MGIDKSRFEKQLNFIIEVDKMKNVFRHTILMDKSRRENDAEHSWHFALASMVLLEYAPENIDINRVIKMALVHDLVEVYAGDTFAFDVEGCVNQEQRELEAADKIFGLLPEEQGREFRALWDEFEYFQTKESCYANAIDRIQPFIHNYKTEGHTWREGNVTKKQVYKRMEPIRLYTPELWKFIEYVVADAIKKGYIRETEADN